MRKASHKYHFCDSQYTVFPGAPAPERLVSHQWCPKTCRNHPGSRRSQTNQVLLTVQYISPEKDPRLRDLTTDVSVLVPAFERDTPTYTLSVSTNCVSLTPTLLLAGQTMTVAGTPAASGTPVVFANLKEGSDTTGSGPTPRSTMISMGGSGSISKRSPIQPSTALPTALSPF